MFDFRLPHYYHLSVAGLLGTLVIAQLRVLPDLPPVPKVHVGAYLGVLPLVWGCAYFVRQYMARRELSVREALFVFTIIQVVSGLLSVVAG